MIRPQIVDAVVEQHKVPVVLRKVLQFRHISLRGVRANSHIQQFNIFVWQRFLQRCFQFFCHVAIEHSG